MELLYHVMQLHSQSFESKSVEMIFFLDQETEVQGNGEPFLKTMLTSMNPNS